MDITKMGALAAMTLAFACDAGAAGYKFGRPQTYPIGSWPKAAAVGDVTGDGRDDVVVTTDFYFDPDRDYHVFVYAQRPDGTLAPPTKYKYAEYTNQSAVALGDLNKDGALDIIVGRLGGLTLLISNGSGGFSSASIPIESQEQVSNIGLMDIDRDGKLDIIAQSWWQGAALLYGNGAGGIRAIDSLHTGANGYNDLKVGDVTGDGIPDLLLVSQQSFDFYVYPHNGYNGFGPQRTYPKPHAESFNSSGAIIDANQDGRNDVVVASSGNGPRSGLWLYLQTADGRLAEPQALPTTYDPFSALYTRDLDRDGRPDLIADYGGVIGRYMQSPNGLQPPTSTRLGANNSWPGSLAFGDLNGDGCTDTAVANSNISALLVVPGCYDERPIDKDFNGDRKSDLLWTRGSEVSVWTMNGGQRLGGGIMGTGEYGYSIVSSGDYNGDGLIDLVWSNGHSLKFWMSQGGGRYFPSDIAYYGPQWQPFASADIDGDGNDDLLWRQGSYISHWLMDGPHVRGSGFTGDGGAGFKLVAAGDFNGDRLVDLALASGATVKIWLNQGGRFRQTASYAYGGGWQPFSASDMDGDGKADLLWRSGPALSYWLMDGATVRQSGWAGTAPAGFALTASGDYDGDGYADLAFATASQMQVWINKRKSGVSGFTVTPWSFGGGWRSFDPQIPSN